MRIRRSCTTFVVTLVYCLLVVISCTEHETIDASEGIRIHTIDRIENLDSHASNIRSHHADDERSGSGSSDDSNKSRNAQKDKDHKAFLKAVKYAAKSGLSGALAGAVQVLALMWLRTSVTWMTAYGGSMSNALKMLYKDGGVLRFYAGVEFALLINPLTRFGQSVVNFGVEAAAKTYPSLPLVGTVWAASVLSGLWRMMLMPLDTCKTVLQVEGKRGFKRLTRKLLSGDIYCLYTGAVPAALSTFAGHYPWSLCYNALNTYTAIPPGVWGKLIRNFGIGAAASVTSDVSSNWLRVLKTARQVSASHTARGDPYPSYMDVMKSVGWRGLLGRGLQARILTNALQSMLFTGLWRFFYEQNWSSNTQK